MGEHPSRARPHAGRTSVILPAEGATLATSLSGGLVLVAHTGKAHLGVPVDRALLRGVTRAQAFLDDDAPSAQITVPEAVAFRHATSHTVTMSSGHVFLTLHATGDPRRADVHVELRMSRSLLRRLVQHHARRQRRRLLALTGCLATIGAALAILSCLT